MQTKQVLRPCVTLLLAGAVSAAVAQPYPCSKLDPIERDFARSVGACRDVAPIVDVAPRGAETAPPAVIPVPNVVGLSFDDARDRLARFTLRRSYRASGEPGGTVLEQQPAPTARLAAGAPVRVVLSDGTLRPAPRVPASDIDAPPNAVATDPDLRPQPSVVTTPTEQSPAGEVVQRGSAVPSSAPTGRAGVEQLRVPNVLGMSVVDAHARLGRFKVERTYRPSNAPDGRVIAQIPTASARTEAGQAVVLVVSSGPARPSNPARAVPVTETFELPNVIGRSYADASGALAEFKVNRIETASAAPSGEVLAQDPAPGTSVPAGSAVRVQVSDGSLASVAVATPVPMPAPAAASAPEPLPAPAPAPDPVPVPSDPLPFAFPSNAVLVLIVGVLLGLMLGAVLMRRWLLGRQPTIDIEPTARIEFSPAEIDISVVPVPETAPEIRFTARHDAGETTIEFPAPAEADEATMEYSNDHHA